MSSSASNKPFLFFHCRHPPDPKSGSHKQGVGDVRGQGIWGKEGERLADSSSSLGSALISPHPLNSLMKEGLVPFFRGETEVQ